MNSYGVVVGRFQVPELHQGHLALLNDVSRKENRMVIFLAVPRTQPTKRNPLDFETRRLMILEQFPHAIILPIQDEKSDKQWSQILDQKIAELTGQSNVFVTMYGSRDSFLKQYTGKFPKQELGYPTAFQDFGFEHRNQAASSPQTNQAFRAGVIYGAYNRLKRPYVTVDCAPLYQVDSVSNQIVVLLGKKPKEDGYRFPGGFVEIGETLEYAAIRETREETGQHVQNLQFVGSFALNDWRYRKDEDAKIVTTLFYGWAENLHHQAADDLEKCEWFPLNKLPLIEDVHLELIAALRNKIGGQYAYPVSTEPAEIG